MDLHVVVCGKPPVQVCFVSGAPQDRPVEEAAVLEAVGQSGDIDGAALSEGVDRKLHFLFAFYQHLGAFQRVDIFLAFPEVDLI